MSDSGEINWWMRGESGSVCPCSSLIIFTFFFLCVFCFSSHPSWQQPVCRARHGLQRFRHATAEEHFRYDCLTSRNLLTPHRFLQGIWEKGNDSCSAWPVSPTSQLLPWLSHPHTTRVCSQTSSPVPCAQEEGKQGLTPQRWFLHQHHPLRKATSVPGAPFY